MIDTTPTPSQISGHSAMAVFISPFRKMIWPQPFERFHTQKSNNTATIIVLRVVWDAKLEKYSIVLGNYFIFKFRTDFIDVWRNTCE